MAHTLVLKIFLNSYKQIRRYFSNFVLVSVMALLFKERYRYRYRHNCLNASSTTLQTSTIQCTVQKKSENSAADLPINFTQLDPSNVILRHLATNF